MTIYIGDAEVRAFARATRPGDLLLLRTQGVFRRIMCYLDASSPSAPGRFNHLGICVGEGRLLHVAPPRPWGERRPCVHEQPIDGIVVDAAVEEMAVMSLADHAPADFLAKARARQAQAPVYAWPDTVTTAALYALRGRVCAALGKKAGELVDGVPTAARALEALALLAGIRTESEVMCSEFVTRSLPDSAWEHLLTVDLPAILGRKPVGPDLPPCAMKDPLRGGIRLILSELRTIARDVFKLTLPDADGEAVEWLAAALVDMWEQAYLLLVLTEDICALRPEPQPDKTVLDAVTCVFVGLFLEATRADRQAPIHPPFGSGTEDDPASFARRAATYLLDELRPAPIVSGPRLIGRERSPEPSPPSRRRDEPLREVSGGQGAPTLDELLSAGSLKGLMAKVDPALRGTALADLVTPNDLARSTVFVEQARWVSTLPTYSRLTGMPRR